MGKKSKKKSKTSTSVGDLHQNQQQQQQQQDQQQELSNNRERTLTEQLGGLALDTVEKAISDGAVCYFCLDEGPDEMGKPVVRDCSCRGNDAGYAHLSCMIKYAEQKSTSLVGRPDFGEPWWLCLNCKQPFKNQLALEMSSACLSFTESTHGHPRQSLNDKFCVMIALRLRIVSIVDFKVECLTVALCQEVVPVDEGKMLSKKLLSMIEQIKKEEQMTYVHLKIIRLEFEAATYSYLAILSADCLELCIAYSEKARDIYQLFGVKDRAEACQNSIDAFRCNDSDTLLKSFKSNYEHSIEMVGSTLEQTIRCGLAYVEQLQKMHHGIEAERLVMKLAADSCRVHGPKHNYTVMVNLLLEKCKKRFVMHDKKTFEALSYEDDGQICVIKGPITERRQADKERILRVSICLIVPLTCCTVVCNGLVSSPHINGKLGDVRDGKLVGKTFRVDVHFEDAELKSAWVRPENLRIAFKLPCNHGAD
jgi:hypothetical protein